MIGFEKYLQRFEKAIARGVEAGMLGTDRMVPVSHGRLASKRIGRLLGDEVESDEVMAIDYYGYTKKSRGFRSRAEEAGKSRKNCQVGALSAKVVHFNGVRLEVLAKIDLEIVADFAEFKREVLLARGFTCNGKGGKPCREQS